jgi:radical SAM superfamily enzyme YgiQ (UPF0313 family)
VEDGYMPQVIAILGGALKQAGVETKFFDTTLYRDVNDKFIESDRKVRESQKSGGFKPVPGFGFEREVVDLKEKFSEVVEEYKPNLIAATSTSFEFNSLLDFILPAKKKFNIPVIIGGSHATVVPEKAIQKEGVDFICIGQGERPLVELVRRMENGEDITTIPSLWVKTPNGEIIKNKIGLQIENMDDTPEADWDLIDERHRIRPFEGEIKRYGWFEISRGCPFSCSYCINSKLHKIELEGGVSPGAYRFFSPTEIIRRMKKYKEKYGFNHVQCIDENMAAMPLDKLKEFAELYKENIGCSFFTQSRPECFVACPEKAKIMAEMGCKMVGLGVESGNEELRRTILNRPMKDGIVEEAVRILKNSGIMVAAYYIIGFPTETEEMIKQTMDLHRRIQPDRFSVRFLHPFPGTSIRNLCVKEGYISEDYEDINPDASFFRDPVLNLPSPPHPTKERLKELKKEFEQY